MSNEHDVRNGHDHRVRIAGLRQRALSVVSTVGAIAAIAMVSGCGAGQQSEAKALGDTGLEAHELANPWDLSVQRRTVTESSVEEGSLPELGIERISVREGSTGTWAQVSLVQLRTSGETCETAIVAQGRNGSGDPVADGYFDDSSDDENGYLPSSEAPDDTVADGYLDEDTRRDGYFRGSLATSNADVVPVRSYTADLGRGCEIDVYLYQGYVEVSPNDTCRTPGARGCRGDAHWAPTRYALSGAAGDSCAAGHEPSSWGWEPCAE